MSESSAAVGYYFGEYMPLPDEGEIRRAGDIMETSTEEECRRRMMDPTLDWEDLPVLVHHIASQDLYLYPPPQALHRVVRQWVTGDVKARVKGVEAHEVPPRKSPPLRLSIEEVDVLKDGPLAYRF